MRVWGHLVALLQVGYSSLGPPGVVHCWVVPSLFSCFRHLLLCDKLKHVHTPCAACPAWDACCRH